MNHSIEITHSTPNVDYQHPSTIEGTCQSLSAPKATDPRAASAIQHKMINSAITSIVSQRNVINIMDNYPDNDTASSPAAIETNHSTFASDSKLVTSGSCMLRTPPNSDDECFFVLQDQGNEYKPMGYLAPSVPNYIRDTTRPGHFSMNTQELYNHKDFLPVLSQAVVNYPPSSAIQPSTELVSHDILSLFGIDFYPSTFSSTLQMVECTSSEENKPLLSSISHVLGGELHTMSFHQPSIQYCVTQGVDISEPMPLIYEPSPKMDKVNVSPSNPTHPHSVFIQTENEHAIEDTYYNKYYQLRSSGNLYTHLLPEHKSPIFIASPKTSKLEDSLSLYNSDMASTETPDIYFADKLNCLNKAVVPNNIGAIHNIKSEKMHSSRLSSTQGSSVHHCSIKNGISNNLNKPSSTGESIIASTSHNWTSISPRLPKNNPEKRDNTGDISKIITIYQHPKYTSTEYKNIGIHSRRYHDNKHESDNDPNSNSSENLQSNIDTTSNISREDQNQKRTRLTKQQKKCFYKWLLKNQHYPYPTSEDRDKLMSIGHITDKGFKYWFANVRNRQFSKYKINGKKYWKANNNFVKACKRCNISVD